MPEDNDDKNGRLKDNAGLDHTPPRVPDPGMAPRGSVGNASFSAGPGSNIQVSDAAKQSISIHREFNHAATQGQDDKEMVTYRTGDMEVDRDALKTHTLLERPDQQQAGRSSAQLGSGHAESIHQERDAKGEQYTAPRTNDDEVNTFYQQHYDMQTTPDKSNDRGR